MATKVIVWLPPDHPTTNAIKSELGRIGNVSVLSLNYDQCPQGLEQRGAVRLVPGCDRRWHKVYHRLNSHRQKSFVVVRTGDELCLPEGFQGGFLDARDMPNRKVQQATREFVESHIQSTR